MLSINSRETFAHRWTWEQANGPIPRGMVVMHICDNPPCVELSHLRLGTHAENRPTWLSKDEPSQDRVDRSFQVTILVVGVRRSTALPPRDEMGRFIKHHQS